VETSVMTFVFLLSPEDRGVFVVDELWFRFIEIWKHTEWEIKGNTIVWSKEYNKELFSLFLGGLTLFQNINHCLEEFLTVTLSQSWMKIDNDIKGWSKWWPRNRAIAVRYLFWIR